MEKIRIFCDSFEKLKIKQVDAVITDPPYGNLFGSQRKKIKEALVNGDDMKWLNMFPAFIAERCSGPVVLFCDRKFRSVIENRMVAGGFNFINDAIWFKRPWGIGYNFRPAHEHILLFSTSKTIKASHHSLSSVLQHNKVGKKQHPTEKPVPLLEELVLGLTKIGDVIFDPFMGSGTTGVASIKTGRRFIGCDVMLEYVELARHRLKECK